MRFPTLTTNDLNGDQVTMPDQFRGEMNLIFIAYTQWQQAEVDSWVPLAKRLEQEISGLRYYELPVVGRMGWFGQKQLDFWMRTGIQDYETRGRTLTLYIDRAKFRQSLAIPDENHIAVLLLDGDGNVAWRGYGPYSEALAADLKLALQPEYI